MPIELDSYDFYEDPYDVYMDSLTQSQRNKHIEETPVDTGPKFHWGWFILWMLLLPWSAVFWPLPQLLWKGVKRLFNIS